MTCSLFCLIPLIFPVLEIFSNRPINGKVKEPKGAKVGITNSFTGLLNSFFFSWYTLSGRKEPPGIFNQSTKLVSNCNGQKTQKELTNINCIL